jgi:hypothetical protein
MAVGNDNDGESLCMMLIFPAFLSMLHIHVVKCNIHKG